MDCGNRAGAFLEFKDREDGVLVKARLPSSLICSSPCTVIISDDASSVDYVDLLFLITEHG